MEAPKHKGKLGLRVEGFRALNNTNSFVLPNLNTLLKICSQAGAGRSGQGNAARAKDRVTALK